LWLILALYCFDNNLGKWLNPRQDRVKQVSFFEGEEEFT